MSIHRTFLHEIESEGERGGKETCVDSEDVST